MGSFRTVSTRQSVFLLGLADHFCGIESIDFGHLAVHQDQVVSLLSCCLEGLLSILSDVASVSGLGEDFSGHHLIDLIVLC